MNSKQINFSPDNVRINVRNIKALCINSPAMKITNWNRKLQLTNRLFLGNFILLTQSWFHDQWRSFTDRTGSDVNVSKLKGYGIILNFCLYCLSFGLVSYLSVARPMVSCTFPMYWAEMFFYETCKTVCKCTSSLISVTLFNCAMLTVFCLTSRFPIKF